MSFSDLGLEAKILRAVTEAGYTEPTPIQTAAIPPILAGHDLIGIAQTGTGKTAAFTLPILTKLAALPPNSRRGTKLLVIAPTRELAVQIEENVRIYAKHLSFTAATIFGGVGEQPQLRALRSGTDMIIACPGRLLDLMGQRAADFSQLKFLVLDEADRMLDMGFLPDIRRIVQQLPKQRQTLMFSATLSREIESLTHEFQQHPKIIQIGRRANPAETVTQLVYEVPKHLKTALLLHLLNDPRMDMVLVFSRMKHAADRLARQLEQKGVRCATLHSNRSQSQRLRALKDFKDGAVRVLVATDIAARGIDVDGISHVVNYDFPMQVEDYVHRIGRTGRANAIGDAISFVTGEDHAELRALERFIGRGIVRKKAEGFNYAQAAPAFNPADEPRRPFARGSQQNRSQPSRPQRPGPSAPPRFGDGPARPPRPAPARPPGQSPRPAAYSAQPSRPAGYGGQAPRSAGYSGQSSRPAGYGGQSPRSAGQGGQSPRPQSYGGPARGPQSGRPPFGARPQSGNETRPPARPVSGNREGGNEHPAPKPAFRPGGFRRRFGAFR